VPARSIAERAINAATTRRGFLAATGRHFRGKLDDRKFDSYGVEWTFDDGTKFFYSGRTMKDCEQKFAVFGQGSKGLFTISARGAQVSLATAMGRFAAHTGRTVTYAEMLDSPDDLAAGVAELTDDSPAPLQRGADGLYPVPMPGRSKYEFRS
jgi:hypothetical protein